MKKVLFLVVALAIGLCGFAQEFKVGNAKYFGDSNGTAKLIEYKKASGDVVIPEKVTDPKTKKELAVTGIGEYAFEKSKVTSVVIPSTITMIGDGAFRKCKQLSKVTLPKSITALPWGLFDGCSQLKDINLDGIECIEPYCFSSSGLTSVTLPASLKSIEKGVFLNCSNLTELIIEDGPTTLQIPDIIYGVPLETLVLGRSYEYSGDQEAQNKPFNNNPALKKITVLGSAASALPDDIVAGCTSLQEIIVNYDVPSQGLLELMTIAAKQGGATVNGMKLGGSETAAIAREIDAKVKWANKRAALDKQLAECESLLYDKPHLAIEIYYKNIKDSEKLEDIPYFKKFIKRVNDSIFMEREYHLNYTDYRDFISYMFREYLSFIVYDDGSKKQIVTLPGLAKDDILHRDDSNKKAAYEDLLRWHDRFIESYTAQNPSGTQSGISYQMAEKLFVLCKLGRWKEAAAFFPTVHRAVTDDGYYAQIPDEITYMQKVINEHGYKAVAPKYKRAQSQSGSSKSDGTVESVTEGVIKGVVNHYQEKRAERKRQEELLLQMNNRKGKRR